MAYYYDLYDFMDSRLTDIHYKIFDNSMMLAEIISSNLSKIELRRNVLFYFDLLMRTRQIIETILQELDMVNTNPRLEIYLRFESLLEKTRDIINYVANILHTT